MKTCFKCGKSLDLCCFYRHPQMSDGYLGKCKSCTKSDVANRAAEKREEILEYERKRSGLPHRVEARRAYAKTEKGARVHAEVIKKHRKIHPEKYQARTKLNNALRSRLIVRECCEKCGEEKAQAHHDDYSKPLEVRWLCSIHHAEHHRIARGKVCQKKPKKQQ